ncbi:hypothetical protein D9M71_678700 [compost metagenome]
MPRYRSAMLVTLAGCGCSSKSRSSSAPGANCSNREYLPRKAQRTVLGSPLRCLPMITSAIPLYWVSGWYTSSRYTNMITSASCSMAPDSRRSDISGRLFGRCSSERLSCESTMTGMPSSMASSLHWRDISLTSSVRLDLPEDSSSCR